jgi:hypothetical protein
MPVAGQTPTEIHLNATTPAAPAGKMNAQFQAGSPYPDPNNTSLLVRDVTANLPNIGGVDPRSRTSETVHLASQGMLVTLTNASAVAVTLDSAAGAGFFCAVQNLGVGTATLTPSSGTINGVANLALATNQGGWLFFDGTNWKAVTGGGASFTPSGDLSGSGSSQEVVGIQSKPIDGGPTDGYALQYSAASGKWEPTALAPAARNINTALPLQGGGELSSDLSLIVGTMTGDSGSGGLRGVVPAPPAGSAAAGKFLKADGTFQVPSSTGYQATYIKSASGTVVSGTCTATFGSNNVAGNALIVIFSWYGTGAWGSPVTPTDSQGNSYALLGQIGHSQSGTAYRACVWLATNIVGGANTVTEASGFGVASSLTVLEYNGLAAAGTNDGFVDCYNAANPASITSLNPKDLILAICGTTPILPFTDSAGWTLRSFTYSATAELSVTGPGTYSDTLYMNGVACVTVGIMALKLSAGAQGIQGIQGNPGNQGDKGGLRYQFDTTTSAPSSSAANGDLRFNNGTIGNVTAIYISDEDVNGDNMQPYIAHWADSTSAICGYIIVKENSNAGTPYAIFSITAVSHNGTYGYSTLSVANIAGTLPANGDQLVVEWIRTGDQGNQGAAGATGATGSGASSPPTIQQTAYARGNGSTLGVSFTNQPATGNILVFLCAGCTANAPTGLTQLSAVYLNASADAGYVYYRVAQGGDSKTWTFTAVGNGFNIAAYEISGLGGLSALGYGPPSMATAVGTIPSTIAIQTTGVQAIVKVFFTQTGTIAYSSCTTLSLDHDFGSGSPAGAFYSQILSAAVSTLLTPPTMTWASAPTSPGCLVLILYGKV